MDESDPQRDAVHASLQEIGPADIDGATVLTGWVLVCEWMDESGNKWLSKAHSASVTAWAAAGLHHEALYGDWPDGEDSEEDDI